LPVSGGRISAPVQFVGLQELHRDGEKHDDTNYEKYEGLLYRGCEGRDLIHGQGETPVSQPEYLLCGT